MIIGTTIFRLDGSAFFSPTFPRGGEAAGTSTKDLSGIKELLRLKYTFTSTDAADAVRIVVPPPAWRPY